MIGDTQNGHSHINDPLNRAWDYLKFHENHFIMLRSMAKSPCRTPCNPIINDVPDSTTLTAHFKPGNWSTFTF